MSKDERARYLSIEVSEEEHKKLSLLTILDRDRGPKYKSVRMQGRRALDAYLEARSDDLAGFDYHRASRAAVLEVQQGIAEMIKSAKSQEPNFR